MVQVMSPCHAHNIWGFSSLPLSESFSRDIASLISCGPSSTPYHPTALTEQVLPPYLSTSPDQFLHCTDSTGVLLTGPIISPPAQLQFAK